MPYVKVKEDFQASENGIDLVDFKKGSTMHISDGMYEVVKPLKKVALTKEAASSKPEPEAEAEESASDEGGD